jgi:protein gp37
LYIFLKGGIKMFNWNPWHGCHKYSEGCKNCFVYVLDKNRGVDTSKVVKSPTMFDYPVQKCKNGTYKFKGHYLQCCFTSDFFIEEADEWRDEIWDMFRERKDVRFLIYTKRVERMKECLPPDWGEGWDNVLFVLTTENQARADERIPQFLDIPLKWRGLGVSPMLGEMHIEKYLETGLIDEVFVCGEGYSQNATILDYDWVLNLREQCLSNKVSFLFKETGNFLLKDGKVYKIPYDKKIEQAQKAKLDKKFAKKLRRKD